MVHPCGAAPLEAPGGVRPHARSARRPGTPQAPSRPARRQADLRPAAGADPRPGRGRRPLSPAGADGAAGPQRDGDVLLPVDALRVDPLPDSLPLSPQVPPVPLRLAGPPVAPLPERELLVRRHRPSRRPPLPDLPREERGSAVTDG